MTDSRTAPWLEPGYGDIVSAAHSDGDIEIEFANGDVVVVPASTFGITSMVVDLEVDADEALSVRVVTQDRLLTDISWMWIRTATDPEFAQEMRRRDAEQSRRLGLRLKALREDRNLSQRDVAQLVGMTPPQLSKIESGTFDLRVSTVQTLLRAMGATFADIADPDALEVSQRTLRKHAEGAGVSRDLMDRLFAHVPRSGVMRALTRGFGWSPEALAAGVPESPRLSLGVRFKAVRSQEPRESPLVNLAYTISLVVRAIGELPSYRDVPSDPAEIRREARDEGGRVTLSSLLQWTWNAGIPVIPLHGRGGFCAAAWTIDDVPVIVLKEAREFAVFWLFDLAHELGHVARGHIKESGLVDVEAPAPGADTDQQETEANDFALRLLLPNHAALLADVRAEARGSHLRFKGAVASVAKRAGISAALLGMVAAYDLTEVGEYKDRWGSASNLSRPEGPGRALAQQLAKEHLPLGRLDAEDRALLDALVLATDASNT